MDLLFFGMKKNLGAATACVLNGMAARN